MPQQSMIPGRRSNGSARRPDASLTPVTGASQQEKADERASDDGMAARPDPSIPTHDDIARAAYLRAEARGFAPGGELDDWLLSEAELNRPPAS